MPPEKTTTAVGPSTPQIENISPADGLPLVYANNVAIGNTAFDLRMIFGEIGDATPSKITVYQKVQVTMSWLQAKILLEFLGRYIKGYEEKNGEMFLPSAPGQVSVENLIPSKPKEA